MSNPCSGCESSCCLNFLIGTELANPLSYHQDLINFPFIRQTGTIRREIGIRMRTLHTHSCDRFDQKTGQCIDYGTRPRPKFCENTGVLNKPNSKCLLKTTP